MYHTRKRTLITGGAGFLGSHLAAKLLKKNHHVLCLDNFSTGSRQNLEHMISHPHFEVICHDICFPFYAEVDEIHNLASPSLPIHHQNDPIQTAKTNFQGSLNMLGLAKRLGIKILQASTSEIYGDPHCHPQPEHYWGNVNPIGERSCYDEGKRCAETLFFDYHRKHKVKIKIARIFNTYGPHMHTSPRCIISNFITQALQEAPLTIYGTGSETHSFCYVDDLVEGLISLMATEDAITGPFNLGNPKECSIEEIARQILILTGTNSKLIYNELSPHEFQKRCPDISLSIKKLGWQPKIELNEGLRKTIDYLKKQCNYSPQFV